MTAFEIWLSIIALAVATILSRSSFFLLGNAVQIPPRVRQALRFAPAAALAGIVAPDLFLASPTGPVDWMNPKLLASVGAAVFFLVSRSMLGTIVVGMALYTALRLYLG